MKRVFLMASILIVYLSINLGNAGAADKPSIIVEKYYSADFDGVRLVSAKYSELMRPLINWENEPGWDIFFVVDKMPMTKNVVSKKNESEVEVRYQNVGLISGVVLLEVDFTEVIIFHLAHIDGQWRIKEPIAPPHISKKAAVQHFERQLNNEHDRERASHLSILIRRLKNL